MAALHELIAQVQDDKLRGQLQAEFNKLRDEKTFGLVFESSAEFFPRADLPVKKNSLVAKVKDIDKTLRVTEIDGDKIFCARDKKTFEFARDEIICVLNPQMLCELGRVVRRSRRIFLWCRRHFQAQDFPPG